MSLQNNLNCHKSNNAAPEMYRMLRLCNRMGPVAHMESQIGTVTCKGHSGDQQGTIKAMKYVAILLSASLKSALKGELRYRGVIMCNF